MGHSVLRMHVEVNQSLPATAYALAVCISCAVWLHCSPSLWHEPVEPAATPVCSTRAVFQAVTTAACHKAHELLSAVRLTVGEHMLPGLNHSKVCCMQCDITPFEVPITTREL